MQKLYTRFRIPVCFGITLFNFYTVTDLPFNTPSFWGNLIGAVYWLGMTAYFLFRWMQSRIEPTQAATVDELLTLLPPYLYAVDGVGKLFQFQFRVYKVNQNEVEISYEVVNLYPRVTLYRNPYFGLQHQTEFLMGIEGACSCFSFREMLAELTDFLDSNGDTIFLDAAQTLSWKQYREGGKG